MEAAITEGKLKDSLPWTFFFRQLLVSSAVWVNSIMFGLNMGAPTVIIPQIRRETNETINIHTESWLSSVLGFSAIPWVFILTILAYAVGRKRTCLLVSSTTLIGFIVFYSASSTTHIVISQVMQGPIASAQVTTAMLIAAEYTSAQYRGIIMTFNAASLFWGIWISNAIGAFAHWKNIGIFGLICSIYSLVSTIAWPESPYWLAMRGRFEECMASHQWLKGTGNDSQKELESLLVIDTDRKSTKLFAIREHARSFVKVILLPEVYKSLALCALTVTMYHFTGKVVCTMYSIQIIKKITSSESAAYTGMLILDGVTVAGMYSGSILMKRFKRRAFFLISTFITILLLITNSIYLYFIKLSLICENVFVSIGLLSILFLVISTGPMILSSTLYSELIPLRSRNICVCLCAFYAKSAMSITLKITPYIFSLIGFHGTLLVFAVICSSCLYLAYKYLPETKNKTLFEISEIFKGPLKFSVESKDLIPHKQQRTYSTE